MTILSPDPVQVEPVVPAEPLISSSSEPTDAEVDLAALERRVDGELGRDTGAIAPGLTAATAFLSVAAVGWLAGGVFPGMLPRLIGVGAAAIGAGIVGLSYRTSRPGSVQTLALPVALIAGSLLVVRDAKGGSANLPGLVAEAIRNGGISTPPVPFDPGWRFLLVLMVLLLAAGATSLAISMGQPKIAVFLPTPLVFGATLMQGGNTPVIYTGIGIILLPAALTLASAVEQAREGASSGRFELRRLARSGVVLLILLAALIVLSTLGLVPEPKSNQVVPPQRPRPPPPSVDRVIFTVQSDRPLSWRLGALDVYDGLGWLMPPFDPTRLQSVAADGRVPAGVGSPEPPTDAERMKVTFTINDIAGHSLPTVASALSVQGLDVKSDPRSQTLRTEQRAREGMRYTVEALAPPSGGQLKSAPTAPPEILQVYTEVPPPPNDVIILLGAAPSNPWDRLQYVRNSYYQKVLASGPGTPVDVPPARVTAMLAGQPASPYEITAGEALLARWAGIPARVGYGYYAGQRQQDGKTFEVRPKNGSSWLEVYFHGYGWLPIVGNPPRATASLSDNNKQQNPEVRPSKELAVSAYVPIRVRTPRLLFELLRYWLARAVPLIILLVAAFVFYPAAIKQLRRARRRRWATATGPSARVLAAYADFRDQAIDLNIGQPVLTPIQFLPVVEDDAEHEELAWLVSRCLWGDLVRDVRDIDADIAEELSASVSKRLRQAQAPTTRLLAAASRISLREPYTDLIPNLWYRSRHRISRLFSRIRARLPRRLRIARGRVLAPAAALVMVVFMLAGCSSGPDVILASRPGLPQRTAPDTLGEYSFMREAQIEKAFADAGKNSLTTPEARAYTVRKGAEVVGSLQIAAFKPGLIKNAKDVDDVRAGVTGGLGSGKFEPLRVGPMRFFVQNMAEQKLLLFFPNDMGFFELFVGQKGFEPAAELFAAVIAYQQGTAPPPTQLKSDAARLDPRRGGAE